MRRRRLRSAAANDSGALPQFKAPTVAEAETVLQTCLVHPLLFPSPIREMELREREAKRGRLPHSWSRCESWCMCRSQGAQYLLQAGRLQSRTQVRVCFHFTSELS